jgi:hypothetical protein
VSGTERERVQIIAHQLVHRLRQEGKLTPEPCEVCGADNAVAHHDDYSKPTEVRWLCGKDHAARHKLLGWGFTGWQPSIRPKGRPPGIKKIRVNLKLTEAVDDAVYETAGELGITKSEYVERALRDALAKDGKNDNGLWGDR